MFRPYADVADALAADELGTVRVDSRADAVEGVVGTIAFEAALVALRRLAQARRSAERSTPGRGSRQPPLPEALEEIGRAHV